MAALVTASFITLVSSAHARADAPLPADFFGVNLNRVLFDDSDPAHTVPLTAARQAGVTHGRIDLPWGAVQPNGPDSVDYRWTDQAIAALAANGIQPTPMLGYSAPWAAATQGNDKTPPRRISDYVRFALLMVRRYGPGGSFWQAQPDLPYLPVRRWEVWNEPNLPQGFWQTGRDPALYARMYLATRSAIKAIDPGARVIVGGMHSGDVAFVTDMYRAEPDLQGNVDGLGIHPYATTVPGVIAAVRAFRAALDAQGEQNLPMEVTEVGWERGGHTNLTVSESTRASDLAVVSNVLARSDCGIDALEPYTWETAERDPDNGEDWYGIWSAQDGLLPSGQAYAATIARFSTQAARVAARSAQLIRICHPPSLRLRMGISRALLAVRVRGGKRAHLTVAISGGGHAAALVHRVKHARGYSYYPLGRSVSRIVVTATARGFAGYRADFTVLRYGHRLKLRRVRPRHQQRPGREPAHAPDDSPAPPAASQPPAATPPPHGDNPPCPLPTAPGTAAGTLPTPVAVIPGCAEPAAR